MLEDQIQMKIVDEIQGLIDFADDLLLTSIIKAIEIKKKIKIIVRFDKNLKDHQSLLFAKEPILIKKEFYILLPENLKKSVGKENDCLRFLLGHELGHLWLHIDSTKIESFKETTQQTLEANLFAIEVLKKRGYPIKRRELSKEFEKMATQKLLNGLVNQKNISDLLSEYCKSGQFI